MPKLLTDICTQEFFQELGTIISGTAGNYIMTYRSSLEVHFIVNYSGLKSLTGYDNIDNAHIAHYIGHRYKESIQKVFDALNIEYNPIANYKMDTTETHSGEDSNERSGSDTASSVTPSKTTHYATTFEDRTTDRKTGVVEHEYSAEVEYGRTDTLTHGHVIETNKEGNNGIRPIQEVLDMEIDMRIRRNMFEFIASCVVYSLSCGMWESDE